MTENLMLQDKVAVVTGAGRGIGREIALMMGRHGAKVVVNDLGAAVDGEGADPEPTRETVADIRAGGAEAVGWIGWVGEGCSAYGESTLP